MQLGDLHVAQCGYRIVACGLPIESSESAYENVVEYVERGGSVLGQRKVQLFKDLSQGVC